MLPPLERRSSETDLKDPGNLHKVRASNSLRHSAGPPQSTAAQEYSMLSSQGAVELMDEDIKRTDSEGDQTIHGVPKRRKKRRKPFMIDI
jgi:hypothetical protein